MEYFINIMRIYVIFIISIFMTSCAMQRLDSRSFYLEMPRGHLADDNALRLLADDLSVALDLNIIEIAPAKYARDVSTIDMVNPAGLNVSLLHTDKEDLLYIDLYGKKYNDAAEAAGVVKDALVKICAKRFPGAVVVMYIPKQGWLAP